MYYYSTVIIKDKHLCCIVCFAQINRILKNLREEKYEKSQRTANEIW